MKSLALYMLVAATCLSGILGCTRPTVVQGTVVSWEQGSAALVVKDENAPNAALTISTKGSDIGGDPRPGDVVRVAYVDEGGSLRATRIMNLTRQQELKQSRSGGH